MPDSQLLHLVSSSGSGLFSGGAQRQGAVMNAPDKRSPSPCRMLVGWFANPARFRAA